MMRGVVGLQISYSALIGVHEMHVHVHVHTYTCMRYAYRGWRALVYIVYIIHVHAQ